MAKFIYYLVHFLAAILSLLFANASFNNGNALNWLFGTMFLCVIFSGTFRWGWMVPCLVLGFILGLMSDMRVKGGSIESQMWETINSLIAGTVFGLLVGFFFDAVVGNPFHSAAKNDELIEEISTTDDSDIHG